jgi:hypothetical protein
MACDGARFGFDAVPGNPPPLVGASLSRAGTARALESERRLRDCAPSCRASCKRRPRGLSNRDVAGPA